MIVVESFRPHHANTLRGFVSVLIPQWHLRIRDIAVNEKEGKRWLSFPAAPMIERARGVFLQDDRGKPRYSPPLLDIIDEKARRRFRDSVLAALIEFAPAAFEPEEV